MAIIYEATINPTKLGLLEAWLPTRSWYPDLVADGLMRLAAARFDDPAGAVGMEIFLVQAPGGPLVQVPLTYRDAPLPGADRWLITTMEHSVLGTRWVYDGVGDPVYVATLLETVRTGGQQAPEMVVTPDGPAEREPLMRLRGSGSQAPGSPATIVRVEDGDPAVVTTTAGELSVPRVLDAAPAGPLTLTGTVAGHSYTLAVLA